MMERLAGAAVAPRDPGPQPPGAGMRSKGKTVIWFLALCTALIISRWVLAPRYLITFDEINFALAVDQFNPALHQPQPPGYPVFVGLLKLVSIFVSKIETVFLIAGFIVSAVSLVLVWWLCELMVGHKRGVIGALLLLFNPAFWLAALTNPVRLCFAAGATQVALCVWLACRRDSDRWLPLAAAGLGVSAGARPALVVLLAPLMLWATFRTRVRWRAAGLSLLLFCAAVGTWLPSLLVATGGWQSYLKLLRGYSDQQFSGSSLLFGATPREALQMVQEAVVWSCLGTLSWVWGVPLIARKPGAGLDAFALRFLALWFFPGLVFYAALHVGDPDHTLSIIPATCVAGAIVLAALTRDSPRAKGAFTISVCILLNVLLFFKPISKTAKASTYAPVQWMAGYIADVIDGIGSLKGDGPVTAVFLKSTTGWRHLSYYHPHVHVVVVIGDSGGLVRTWHIVGQHVEMRISSDRSVALPACGTLAWVDPMGGPVASGEIAIQSAAHSRVFFTPAAPGESFEFRGARFLSGGEACSSEMPQSARQ